METQEQIDVLVDSITKLADSVCKAIASIKLIEGRLNEITRIINQQRAEETCDSMTAVNDPPGD